METRVIKMITHKKPNDDYQEIKYLDIKDLKKLLISFREDTKKVEVDYIREDGLNTAEYCDMIEFQ